MEDLIDDKGTHDLISRRQLLVQASAAAVVSLIDPVWTLAEQPAAKNSPSGRPPVSERHFRSQAVELYLQDVTRKIDDPVLAQMFANCFPNTLDTTVQPGAFEGNPDTAVITGDIPAMWLRDYFGAGVALPCVGTTRRRLARSPRRRHPPPNPLHPDRSICQRIYGQPQRSASLVES